MLGYALLGLVTAASLQSAKPPQPPKPPVEIAVGLSKVDRALFKVETASSTGSGFAYRSPGYVLTNKHVVDDVPVAGAVTLRPVKVEADGEVGVGAAISGKVRYKHPDLDVAVIEVVSASSPSALSPIATRENKHVPRGVEVFAHGFPLKGTPTLSRGLLSAHYVDPLTGATFYLSDTALSPGSSGGPVTDAAGAVIGIATAVSIVVDGAGASWGYILPIRVVDQALGCQQGLLGLPPGFDLGKHVRAIKEARTADLAMARYRVAALEAAKLCPTARDLVRSAKLLLEAVTTCGGSIPRSKFSSFNDDSLKAGAAVMTRLFEFSLIDSGNLAQQALSDLYGADEDDAYLKWLSAAAARSIDALPAEDRAVGRAELLSTHADGVSSLMAAANSNCSSLKLAAEALESDKPTDRKSVGSLARALAALVQTRLNLALVDPDLLQADDPDLPVKARQKVRICKANLQNCKDEWAALPEDCRSVADLVLESMSKAAPEAPVQERDRPAGAAPEAMGPLLEFWKESGFAFWGDVKSGVAKGNGDSFNLDFDEAPSCVWIGVRAPEVGDLSVSMKNFRGEEFTPIGGLTQVGVDWTGFEIRSDGKVSFAFESAVATGYPFEVAVVYRRSLLSSVRKAYDEKHPDLQEVAVKSFILDVGASIEFSFSGDEWSTLSVIAVDPSENDIDLVVLDATGREVGRDTEADHYPEVLVERVSRGNYTFRFTNAGKRAAIVDSMVFGMPR